MVVERENAEKDETLEETKAILVESRNGYSKKVEMKRKEGRKWRRISGGCEGWW